MGNREGEAKIKPADRNRARKIAIRHAAVRHFSERGYDRTSLKDIADSVDLTHPALYYYYQSKEAILFDAVSSNVGELCDVLRASLLENRAETVDVRLRRMAEQQVLFQLRYRGMAPLTDSVLFGPLSRADVLSAGDRQALTQLQRILVGLYRAEIEEGLNAGVFVADNPAIATFTMLGAISYVVYWLREDGPQTQDAVAAMIADFCLAALMKGGGVRPAN